MKFIKLTDFGVPGRKHFINPEAIAAITNYAERHGASWHSPAHTLVTLVVDVSASREVLETPEEIMALIWDASDGLH